MRPISERYRLRLARLVSLLSARTSSSGVSTRGSSGASTMTSSSPSSLIVVLGLDGELLRGHPRRQRQQVQRIDDPAVVSDLEVQVRAGGAPRLPHVADLLPGDDAVADLHA